MPAPQTNSDLSGLIRQIESLLGWGDSRTWSTYDLEQLSDLIRSKTGVSLSLSTLKRVLGKVNYQNTPSLTTLNTLARFLDCDDWRDWLRKQKDEKLEEYPAQPKENRPAKKAPIFLLPIVVLFAVVAVWAFNHLHNGRDYDPADFSFRSKTVLASGVPNSVVFDYDASKANSRDTVFISQTWDVRRKVQVNKDNRHHSAIYYYPGYFRAKLIVGNRIMKEHDIHVTTNGWLGLAEAEWGKEPLYFTQNDLHTSDGEIRITMDLLKKYAISRYPTVPKLGLFHQGAIQGVKSENFTFETQVKYLETGRNNSCQHLEIWLQGKNDVLILPLAQPACVGNLVLSAFGPAVRSETADLSGFGCNLMEWVTVKVECRNGFMNVYLNGEKVYATQIKRTASEIVGLQYRFNGPAAVRHTWLQGNIGKRLLF